MGYPSGRYLSYFQNTLENEMSLDSDIPNNSFDNIANDAYLLSLSMISLTFETLFLPDS